MEVLKNINIIYKYFILDCQAFPMLLYVGMRFIFMDFSFEVVDFEYFSY
jgi:hypothetical protein